MAYEIVFAANVEEHLRALSARERQTVLSAVARSLRHEPNVESRKRKRMRPNLLAAWELRVGDLRVYYRLAESPEFVVEIAAVGEKRGNEIWIAGERVEL